MEPRTGKPGAGTFFVILLAMAGGYSYIDGFNLYHGLDDAGYQRHLWINLHCLSTIILAHFGYTATLTRYYTSKVADSHPSYASQRMWLKAVGQMEHVKIEIGAFQDEFRDCDYCGRENIIRREKKTDVNLGVQAYEDVLKGRADAVLLITGDSDQVPTMTAIKRHKSDFPVFVAFPPRRRSGHLQAIAGKSCVVDLTDETWLTPCQLPEVIDEFTRKPAHWV